MTEPEVGATARVRVEMRVKGPPGCDPQEAKARWEAANPTHQVLAVEEDGWLLVAVCDQEVY